MCASRSSEEVHARASRLRRCSVFAGVEEATVVSAERANRVLLTAHIRLVAPRVFLLPLLEKSPVVVELVIGRTEKLFDRGIGVRALHAAPLKLFAGPLHACERARVVLG